MADHPRERDIEYDLEYERNHGKPRDVSLPGMNLLVCCVIRQVVTSI